MSVFVSPGVYTTERDFSLYAPALATSIFGVVTTASKGPTDERVFITDEGTLIETFGPPSAEHVGLYAAIRYLRKGRQLIVVRVAHYDAYAECEHGGLLAGDGGTVAVTVTPLSSGSWANSISITVAESTQVSGAYRITVSDNGVPVEVYNNVLVGSENSASANYIETLINGSSRYISVADQGVGTTLQAGTYSFSGGDDGYPVEVSDIIGTSSGTIRTGLQLFRYPEEVDVNLLAVPGYSQSAILNELINICEERGDCMCLIDPPYGLSVQEVISWHNGTSGLENAPTSALNSSYAALYYPWLQVYDSFNDQNVWVPPSGHVAGVIAYTDFVADPWWAPAGLDRARLSDVLAIEYAPNQGDRDWMYSGGNAVNPITNIPGHGIVIWGQRTLQREPTALDRINVRRLLLYLRKVVATASARFVFEPNDSTTWRQFKRVVEPICRNIQSRRGIYDFRVICDETTNTPFYVDRNEMRARILLKPTKTAEIITVEAVLLSSGARFEEFTG